MSLRTLLIVVLLAGCGAPHSSDRLMAQARQYQARGETKSAIIELKNILQKTPTDGPARLALGRLHLDTGDVLSAEKELRRALELGVNPGEALPPLGTALLLQGQYDKVLEQIKADQQQPKLQALRGHALLGLDRSEEAVQLFKQVLVRHPEHPAALLGQARIALREREREAAQALIERALAQSPKEVDAWRMKGDVLRLQGKTREAMQAYQHLLKLHPTQAQAHVDLASLHIQSGKLEQAHAELAIARKVAPGSLMLIYTQALLDFHEGKLGAAQENLQLVMRAAPEHLPSNLLMGAVLRGQGSFAAAGQYLRKFLAANPGHPYASKLLASVLMNTGAADQALVLVEPLFASHQQDLEMMSLAGEIHMRLRQFPKAASYFERASALSPQVGMLHAALAMSHMGMGDNTRAIAELERATALDTKSSRAGVLLVLAQLRGKEYGGALVSVKRMEAQQADNPMVQNLKGGVLLMNRDSAAARIAFERALKADSSFLPALDNLTQLDLKEKQPEHARLRLEHALGRDKKNGDIMAALANLALIRAQPSVARTWLERAAAEHPDDVEASLRLAAFYARNNQVGKALVLAQKLLTTNPSNADTLVLLAQLQAQSGIHDDSLENWSKLAALQPDSAEIQLRIAEARSATHDDEGALKAVHKALALQPDSPQVQVALTRLLIGQRAWPKALQTVRGFQKARSEAPLGFKLEGDVLMAQKQIQPALLLYRKAYDMQPSAPFLIPLYSALVQSGNGIEGRKRMQQWLAGHAGDHTTRLYFASSLLAEKDFPASTAQFEQLLRQAPNNAIVLNNLAWLYQQQKDGRALGLAEQAHRLAPASPLVLDTLGWILVEQGQVDRAVPLLKQAVELAPADPDIRRHLEAALAKSNPRAALDGSQGRPAG